VLRRRNKRDTTEPKAKICLDHTKKALILRKMRITGTYNGELAAEVLIESPPAAGADGFAENIV
jgi:hypothetical protein